MGLTPADLGKNEVIKEALSHIEIQKTAQDLQIGEPTLRDITLALQKPGRDPREELPKPLLRSDVLSIEDITPGMEAVCGPVRNVVDFGAFVDIGIKNDGLVHISELGQRYVKHPLEVVAVGDIVKVKVLAGRETRNSGRVSLTMKF